MFFIRCFGRIPNPICHAVMLAALVVARRAVWGVGPYGNCEVLFVGGKAQRAPSQVRVTPLCEEDDDTMLFASAKALHI